MATFDFDLFLITQASTRSVLDSVGAGFGVPQCAVNLSKSALSLLPSPILNALLGPTEAAQESTENQIKRKINELFLEFGIIEFDTEDGVFKFTSESSNIAREFLSGSTTDAISEFIGAINGTLNVGADVYLNYKATKQELDRITKCLEGLNQALKMTSESSPASKYGELTPAQLQALNNAKYGARATEIDDLKKVRDGLESKISEIVSILDERAKDPTLEPELTEEAGNLISDQFKSVFKIEDDTQEDEPEVFRLVFGPPETKKGRFLLSSDGLYYDSQTSGITPALLELEAKSKEVAPEFRWTFDYDANIGGKGEAITSEEIKQYTGTLFDPNIVDDSETMNRYYDADNFLQILLGQRDKAVTDVNMEVERLRQESASQAVIDNTKQSLLSEVSLHTDKVNRRKKQIEVAIKAPSIYGKAVEFSPGEIPINDFSYLQKYNIAVDLGKQKGLVLHQDEVSGVVLPITTEFVVSKGNEGYDTLDYLVVPEVGLGEVIHDTSDAQGQTAGNFRITDSIFKSGLISVYNFLSTETSDVSSLDFLVNDSSHEDAVYNAKLVGEASSIFRKGLGTPYLEGITKHPNTNPTDICSVGSYAKLPDTPDHQDLMYSKKGFTIDFWTYVPSLFDPVYGWRDSPEYNSFVWIESEVSSTFRLILANENTGLAANAVVQDSQFTVSPDNGDSVVKGFIMGFTRDERIITSSTPTETFDSTTSSGIKFFLAPTQSYDGSTVSLISRVTEDNCVVEDTPSWYNMSVDLSAFTDSSATMEQVCQEYKHISLSVDPKTNTVSLYLDGEILATSSTQDVFGVEEFHTPRIPNFYKTNSFRYESSAGPELNNQFTPWIVGGGYTDGQVSAGNFMGSGSGGVNSGYRGHIGSLKLYSEALDATSVEKNYDAQKGFFKNIRTVDGCSARVFFLLGQSNANGEAAIEDIPDASAHLKTAKFDRVWINNNVGGDKGFRKLEVGLNNISLTTAPHSAGTLGSLSNFGPEVTLASALADKYPDDEIYIVKQAINSSFLATSANYGGLFFSDWSLSTDASKTGTVSALGEILFSGVTNWFSEKEGASWDIDASAWLQNANKDMTLGGIFWVQGEADALALETANAYETNLTAFISGLRAKLGTIPFVISRIPAENTNPYVTTISAAQDNIVAAVELVALANTDGVPLQSEKTHFTAEGYLTLGTLLAEAFFTQV